MGTLWLDCPTLTSVVALTTLKNCWPARTDHPVTEQDRFLKAASDVRAGGVERSATSANRISRRAFRGRMTDKFGILIHHVEYTLSAPHGRMWHAPHIIHSIFFAATHLPLTIGRQSQDMTEIPEGPGNPPSEPNLQETTEPIPDVTPAPDIEAAGPASPTAESRSRWRWPAKTRNRIAASVAVAAGAAAIGAAVFTGGLAVGAHTAGHGEGHHQWGHYSAAAAQREGAPVEQIWIVPGGPGATGHDGFIITGTESASTASPG
jgi:hypothetical protein